MFNKLVSSIKQYLHCLFESVTIANSSIVIHFQMTLPFLCPSDLGPDPMLHPHIPPPPVLQRAENLLLLSYCIVFKVSARVTNRLHKKPITLRRIYEKVTYCFPYRVLLIQLYFHYDSNTIGLFTVANLT